MKREASLMLAALMLLTLQGAALRGDGFMTDVGALVLVFIALERPVLLGAFLAIAVGYLSDVYSGTTRGLYAAVYVIAFFMIRLPLSRVRGGGVVLILLVSLVATTMMRTLAFFIEHIVGPGHSSLSVLFSGAAGTLVGAGLLSYPVYRLLRAIDERFKEREEDFVFRP